MEDSIRWPAAPCHTRSKTGQLSAGLHNRTPSHCLARLARASCPIPLRWPAAAALDLRDARVLRKAFRRRDGGRRAAADGARPGAIGAAMAVSPATGQCANLIKFSIWTAVACERECASFVRDCTHRATATVERSVVLYAGSVRRILQVVGSCASGTKLQRSNASTCGPVLRSRCNARYCSRQNLANGRNGWTRP